MKQVIDMGGFKNEVIEVCFGTDKYEIQLDPPIEIYRQVLSMQGKKFKTEKDWDDYKKIATDIICINNPDINKEEFFKSLTKVAATRFINAYTNLLFKGSDLKNSLNPPSKSKEDEIKEEKK